MTVTNIVDMHEQQDEGEVRVQLAALYRIVDHLGWTELIFNHITAKVPGSDEHFLINPFGLHYSEVTASNLVKVDLAGNLVGESDWGINPAGYVIHSTIHAARADVNCVMHTHTTTGQAVSCLAEGLTLDNFNSAMLQDQVAYHTFEGTTVRDDEKSRIEASLGAKNFLILRNHGLLTCGETVAQAFTRMWLLQRACDVQIMAASTGRSLNPIDPDALAHSTRYAQEVDANLDGAALAFRAMQRKIDAIDPGYRD